MSDTRDFLLEEVKYLLKDIDTFLTINLKKEKLKKENSSKRDELTQQITSVLSKIDKILPQEEQEEYADVEVEPEPPAPIEEEEELYEDTAAPESPNKNAMSRGSDKDSAENDNDWPEAPEEIGEPYGDMKVGPIAATDLNTPSREGFLEKRRKEGQLGLQQWQRRYCVIKDNVFYYFKNRNDKQQRNVIVLNGYEARPAPDFDKKNKKKDCIFEVICPAKRSYQFIAQSVEEMKAWIDTITAASAVMPAPEPSPKPTPEPSVADGGFKDMAESIPEEEFGETYEDVDSYQRTPVGKQPEPSIQNSEEDSMIYDDAETAPIEEEMDEVYEDVSSHPAAPATPARELPHRPPAHIPKPLPSEPPTIPPSIPPAPSNDPPPVPAHVLTQPATKLPPVPVQRSKPEPPKRQAEEKPAPPPPVPSRTEPWEEDYENIYMGLWDCYPDDDNELEFKRGDLVHIVSKRYDTFNWWIGEKNNKIGLVPKEYLMMAYML